MLISSLAWRRTREVVRRLNSTAPREEEMDQCCRVTLIQGREFGPALDVELERRPSISNTNAALQLCIWVLIIFAFLLGAYIEVCVLYRLQICIRFCRVFCNTAWLRCLRGLGGARRRTRSHFTNFLNAIVGLAKQPAWEVRKLKNLIEHVLYKIIV